MRRLLLIFALCACFSLPLHAAAEGEVQPAAAEGEVQPAAAEGEVQPAAAEGEPQAAATPMIGACTQCHVSANPTPESHEMLACLRHTNGAASKHGSSEAPDYFIIDRLVDLYTPVVFPHKLHAGMSELDVGCARCHHYSEGDKIPKCETCHDKASNQDNLEQPGLKGAYHRQCLGCHREWSHETQCSVCHPKRDPNRPIELPKDAGDIAGQLHPNVQVPDLRVYKKPDLGEDMAIVSFHHKDHVDKFGRKCAECHRKWDCSKCHTEGEAAVKEGEAKSKFEDMDLHQACGLCHQKQVDDNCVFCHDKQERPAFDHQRRTGFLLRAYHTKLDCTACHKTRGVFTGLIKKCESCHTGDTWPPKAFDHTVIGLKLDEAHSGLGCPDCHANGLSEKRTCDSCHDDKRESFPEPKKEETPAAP